MSDEEKKAIYLSMISSPNVNEHTADEIGLSASSCSCPFESIGLRRPSYPLKSIHEINYDGENYEETWRLTRLPESDPKCDSQ